VTDEDFLAHYGTLHKSGRYPWGSGKDPYQDGVSFLAQFDKLHKSGISEKNIALAMGFTSTAELRAVRSISSTNVRQTHQRTAVKLRDTGMSPSAISREMHIPEPTVRNLLDPVMQARANRLDVAAKIVKDNVEKYKYVDIGKGTANHLQISDTQLATVLAMLKDDGHRIFYIKSPQAGTTFDTSYKILAKDTVLPKEIYQNKEKIHFMSERISQDVQNTIVSLKPPVQFSSKRLGIVYGPDGGAARDGVMYLRPGVGDISLGDKKYAQVRIAVDGTHYLKGMAQYKNDLPAGVDILFHTNKKDTGNKLDALKNQNEEDKLNPFGAITTQREYTDAKGKKHQSVLNILNEEGKWATWSKNFSSQFLSKQTTQLAKQQLGLTSKAREAELADIMALTNPAVKQKLLETFADETDAAAVRLHAVSLPRTASHVILPIESLKDTEVYAPNYQHGEVVVLVRHPHGGKFEIPQLTVNNKNKEALANLKNAKDAIGINANVAQKLSGADFDGDHVLVIPNNHGHVKIAPGLALLKDFDTKSYTIPEGSGIKGLKDAAKPDILKQTLMGDISNLITDMTIKGANNSEIARAVKHSMVVIDAEKWNLDYKQSYLDNNIKALKVIYQNGANKGAATLISKSTSDKSIPLRKNRLAPDGGWIDPKTGERQYVDSGKSWVDANGKLHINTFKVKKGALTNDARTLIDGSGTPIEHIYADHANHLKALANKARKETLFIKQLEATPSAKIIYKEEVARLNVALNMAIKNAPREREAQLLANHIIEAKKQAKPAMSKDELKKIKGQAIQEARFQVGAKKPKIVISDKEWEAIQAGAITPSKLKAIMNNTDLKALKERATPRDRPTMNESNVALAKSMLEGGYNVSDIAARLGVSTSTIYSAVAK
jgi:DNA-binding CsgD family transcriptional regulator